VQGCFADAQAFTAHKSPMACGRGRTDEVDPRRNAQVLLASVVATLGIPAVARQEIKIGIGFGIASLPYLCQELLSVKKEVKAGGSVE
jgi:hypothetical protein